MRKGTVARKQTPGVIEYGSGRSPSGHTERFTLVQAIPSGGGIDTSSNHNNAKG